MKRLSTAQVTYIARALRLAAEADAKLATALAGAKLLPADPRLIEHFHRQALEQEALATELEHCPPVFFSTEGE